MRKQKIIKRIILHKCGIAIIIAIQLVHDIQFLSNRIFIITFIFLLLASK